ncbi:hypothetical protein GXW78_26820 [Roseomonas terrae]|uniref:Uncharacterized protein n=1 Tax=Neoroseomonas terrae TaxID=424799 RepID=A0ABS5EQH8_9PROT|nr:hypothetical protein [Neoroseomonas terrae]MBR0653295.1 hypothetical protein [Neoroseomonas terrae]
MVMVRANQVSFTAGEIGPDLAARIEVSRYYSGAKLLRNVLVKPQGGIKRRPGTAHLHDFTGGEGMGGVRCIPFAFNTEQTYCIVLTGGQFHVWRSDGLYLATVGSCPWSAGIAAQANHAQSADTLLLFHPDMRTQRLRRGGVETSWTIEDVTWSNVPQFNFGDGDEDMISDARGWPECGTFHQGRLWLGGPRSRPATFIASKIGDFFNLDKGTTLDDEAIVGTIDSDQVNAIHQMVSGRALQIFTSGAEHVITGDPLTPKTIGVAEQTRRGIKRFTRTVEVDGATLFAQRGGAALRQFLFVDTEQAWRADIASLLAPHLVLDPIDMAARKTARQDDADRVLMVNANGSVTVLTTLRSQEVTAFSRWETDGIVRSAAALLSGEVFFAVERGGRIHVELWAEMRLLDVSKRRTEVSPFKVVPGLSHLEGRQVVAVADGAFFGPFTVSGYSITLPRQVRDAEVGLFFPVEAETLPIEPRHPSGAVIGRRTRIATITARVRNTGHFRLNNHNMVVRGVGGPPVAPLDSPPPVFTGDITVRGLVGYRLQNTIRIDQPTPQPFELLGLAYEVRIDS